jgi:hypothetical protein
MTDISKKSEPALDLTLTARKTINQQGRKLLVIEGRVYVTITMATRVAGASLPQ